MKPSPAIATDIVRAFRYGLTEQLIAPGQAMDAATLMLELASLHHYLALQRQSEPVCEQQRVYVEQCRTRIDELSRALGLSESSAHANATAGTAPIADARLPG